MLYEVKNLKEVNVVFKRLNNLRRWGGVTCDSRYDEISKQALNCLICFVLAIKAENEGVVVKWERFPKIAIYRAFQKAYVNYDTPEHVLREICQMGNIHFEQMFKKVTFDVISEVTDDDFASELEEGCGTIEETIYKAATKIATLIEIKEMRYQANGSYTEKYDEVMRSMAKYWTIPGFKEMSNPEGAYFKMFSALSKLRNQNRWAAYSYRVACSVLGHLFDTGIFAYFMALEKGYNEEIATKCFFMGIYHDVPEAFTRDIPSPIKDKIPGFRELTEQYELRMMEKNVYPFVDDFVRDALKKIMFEDEENSEFKKLMKGADYLSAVSEICRQLEDGNFKKAIENHDSKFSSGIAELTENARLLYDDLATNF